MSKFNEYIIKVLNKKGDELMRMPVSFARFERLKEYCEERGLTYEILATI